MDTGPVQHPGKQEGAHASPGGSYQGTQQHDVLSAGCAAAAAVGAVCEWPPSMRQCMLNRLHDCQFWAAVLATPFLTCSCRQQAVTAC
jgi:hypothetical protein